MNVPQKVLLCVYLCVLIMRPVSSFSQSCRSPPPSACRVPSTSSCPVRRASSTSWVWCQAPRSPSRWRPASTFRGRAGWCVAERTAASSWCLPPRPPSFSYCRESTCYAEVTGACIHTHTHITHKTLRADTHTVNHIHIKTLLQYVILGY